MNSAGMDPIKMKTKATIDSIDAVLAFARELCRENDALATRTSALLNAYSLETLQLVSEAVRKWTMENSAARNLIPEHCKCKQSR